MIDAATVPIAVPTFCWIKGMYKVWDPLRDDQFGVACLVMGSGKISRTFTNCCARRPPPTEEGQKTKSIQAVSVLQSCLFREWLYEESTATTCTRREKERNEDVSRWLVKQATLLLWSTVIAILFFANERGDEDSFSKLLDKDDQNRA